jgi:hypothetical protein
MRVLETARPLPGRQSSSARFVAGAILIGGAVGIAARTAAPTSTDLIWLLGLAGLSLLVGTLTIASP